MRARIERPVFADAFLCCGIERVCAGAARVLSLQLDAFIIWGTPGIAARAFELQNKNKPPCRDDALGRRRR